MADRLVSVKVDLSATGNLGSVARAAQKDLKSLSSSNQVNVQNLGSVAGKAAVAIGTMQAAALGFVGAASPAAFQTFTGSVQLAAGEIGIMLIPAIVKVSAFFQDMAGFLRDVNMATGGLIGNMAKAVAVPLTVIGLGAAAVKTGTWLFGLGTSAQAAAASLNLVAASGAASSVGGVAGAAGKAGGLLSRFNPAGFGVGAVASLAGGAIGGTAGSYLSAAGTGAMIGSIGGPIGAAVGAGVGLLVNAISKGFEGKASKEAKLSMNFQAQSSDIGSMHDIIQREAIRDPMQQAQFEQQAKATEKLAEEVGYLSQAVRDHPYQVGA